MGRRRVDAAGEPLPQMVRRYNAKNERKTMAAMAEDIWATVESGKERRRRQACERLYGLAENQPVETATPLAENQPVETATPLAENQPVETATPLSENRPVETATPLAENQPVETATPLAENQPVETVTPLAENQPVETATPLAENQPVETATPLAENQPVETATPLAENQPVETATPLAENQPVETATPLSEKTVVEVSGDHAEPLVAQSSSEQACTDRARIEKANGAPVSAKSDEMADSSSTNASERQAKDEKASVFNKRDQTVQEVSGQSVGTQQVEEEVAHAHIKQPDVADAPTDPIGGDEGEIDERAHMSLKQDKVDQIPGAQDCEDRVLTRQMEAPTAPNDCAPVTSTSNEKVHECREEIQVVQEAPVDEKPVQAESEPTNFANESGAQCEQKHSTPVSSNQIDEAMIPDEAEMHVMAQHSQTNTLNEHEPEETFETMKESIECASPQVCPNGSSEGGTQPAEREIHTGTQSPKSQQTEKKTDILDLKDGQTKTTTDAKKKKREKKKGKHADDRSDLAAVERLPQNESVSRDKEGPKADGDKKRKRNKNKRKPESDTGHVRIGSTDEGEAVDVPMVVQSLSTSPDRTASEEHLLPSAVPASPGANEPLHESQQVSDASLPADGVPAVGHAGHEENGTDKDMKKYPETEQSRIRPQDASSQQKATGKFNVVCDDDYLAETPTLEVVDEEWTTVETKRGKMKRKRSERKSESEQKLYADDVHESETEASITTSTRLSPEAPDVQITSVGISKQVIGLSAEVNGNCTESSAPAFFTKKDPNGEQEISADKSVNDAKGYGTSSAKNAEEAEVKEGAILDAFDLLMSSGEGLAEGLIDDPASDEKMEENCLHDAVTSTRVDTSEEQLDQFPPETSQTMDAFDLLMSSEDDLNKGFMESFETEETAPIGPVVIEEKPDAELDDKIGEVIRTPQNNPTDALDLLLSSGDGLQEGSMEEYEPKKQINIKQTTEITNNADCPDTFTSEAHHNVDAKKSAEYKKKGNADCSLMLESKTNALDPSVSSAKDQKSGYDEALKPDQLRLSEPTKLPQTTTDVFDLLMSAGEGLNEGFEESFGSVHEATICTAKTEQTTDVSTKYYEGAKEANSTEYKTQVDVIGVLTPPEDMSKGFKQSIDIKMSTADEPIIPSIPAETAYATSVPEETTYVSSVPAETTKSDKEPFKMVHAKDESRTDAFELTSGVGLQEEASPHETSENEFSTARAKDVRDLVISCPDHSQNGFNETVGLQHECNRLPKTVESESNTIIKSNAPMSEESLASVQPVGSPVTTAVLSGSDIDGGISEHVDEVCTAPENQFIEHAALNVLESEDVEQHPKEAVLTQEKLHELTDKSEKTHAPNTIIDLTSGKTDKEEKVDAKREAEARQADEDQERSQNERIPDSSSSDHLQGSGKSEHYLDEKLILPEMHDYASHEQTMYDAALCEAAEVRFYERMARSNSFDRKTDTKSAAVQECVVEDRGSPSTVVTDQPKQEKSCAEMVPHSSSELPAVALQVQWSSEASHTGVMDHMNDEEPCAEGSPQSNIESPNVASQALPTSEASPAAVPVSDSSTWFDKALHATAEARHHETLAQRCSGGRGGSGSRSSSGSGSFPVYECSCDHFTAEDDQATDGEFAPCENAVPRDDSLWVESKIYNVADATHGGHSSPEAQPESTELAPSADSPHPVAPTQINATGTANSEVTVVSGPLQSPSGIGQSLDGVRSASSAANSAASPLSPLSPQHEPDDVYFEDVVLAGRQSDVTMAALRGFTASPLSEGLAPGEQLDSLRTEPDLELSEPGTADILEDGDEAAHHFFYDGTEGAGSVVEEARQERPPPVLAERLSTPELKTEIPTPGLAEGLQSPKLDDGLPSQKLDDGLPSPKLDDGLPSPKLDDGLPSPQLQTDIPAVALTTDLPSPTLAGEIPPSTIGTGIGVPDITTNIPPVSLTAEISELAVASEILAPVEAVSTTTPVPDGKATFKPVRTTTPPPVQPMQAAESVQAIAAPPPVEPMQAAEPVQVIAAPPTVQAMKESEPIQVIAAPPSLEAIKAAEPVQAIAAPPSLEAIKAAEPVQAIAAPPSLEAIKAAEPVQAIAAPPPVEAIKAAEPVQAIAAPPSLEAIKAAEPVQAIAAPPPVEAIKAAEPVQAIAAPPTVQAIKAAEPVQAIAAPPPVEAIQAAEPVQAIAAPPPVEAIQAAEPVVATNPATSVQTVIAPTLSQAAEAPISTTGTNSTSSLDSDCLASISTSTAMKNNEGPSQDIGEQEIEPAARNRSGKKNNTVLEHQQKENKESEKQVTSMNLSDTPAKEINEKLGLTDDGRVSPKESDEEIISFTGQGTPRSPIITKKINRKKKTKSGRAKSNATVIEKKPTTEEPSSAKDDPVIPKPSTSSTCATTAPSAIESIATASPPTGDTPAGSSASVVSVTVTTPTTDASVETTGHEAAASAAEDSVPAAPEATPSDRLETRSAGRLVTPATSRPILADRTLFLPGDEGRTYASLMQQGADMLPARPVFHAHACHVCKRLHTKQHRLKSCGSCRLVAYCSAEHQRAHWPLHRALCRVITRRLRHLGTQHLYREALNVSAPQHWKRIRFKHMAVCEEMLDRPMEPYEKEMFLYPRACDTCHETSPERLRTCTACHSVSFCCDAHLRKTHAKFCKDLRLLLDIHSHQNAHGVCQPSLPDTVLAEYAPLPPHIREFLVVSMLGPQRALQMGAVELAVLSECASYPLTLLYALQNIPVAEEAHVSRLEQLTVHVVGAEFATECEPLARWDVFLLNVLPRLRRLHVVFVGTELEVADGRPGITEQDFTCRPCLAAGKRFTCEFQPNTAYHTYCRSPQFRPPHVVCAFNAGLHRHAGHESRDTWRDSLPHLVRDGVPLVLTGYTLLECPQDVARVQQEQRVDVLLPPMKNPYRSTRPVQNFLNEHEAPLVFKNQYVACLMAAGKARK